VSFRHAAAALVLTLSFSFGLVAHVEAARVRVDGTVATVAAGGDREPLVVLYSDLELRVRLRLAGEAGIDAPERVTIDDSLLRDAFREAISESLLYMEAQRVQVAPPTQEMIDAEWRRFFQAVGGASRLERVRRALSAREDEITAVVEQRAWIAAFLEANLRGSDDVDVETVERVFASGEHPFTGQTLEQAREPLRAWIRSSRVENAVRAWVDALRGRASIVISPAWAPLLDHPFERAE
jgi:hypothetical protein